VNQPAPPDPKHTELALKRHELIQREYQILGDYLKEARSLGVSIGSMALAIAGGTLTLSIGQVLKGDGVELPPDLFRVLHIGWGLLLGTIAGVVGWAFNLAITMWNHSRRWRNSLETGTRLEQPTTSEVVGWFLATTALVMLILGLASLGYVAINVPQKVSTVSRSTSPAAAAPAPAAPASTATSRPAGS